MSSIAIVWAQFGPYHLARLKALRAQAGSARVHGIELSDRTQTYQWSRKAQGQVTSMCPGVAAERLSFAQVLLQARRTFLTRSVDVCLLPSYSPQQSFAALLAAKSLGIRTVMMNESHAGTSHATGVAGLVKKSLVRLFDAALVGGKPHKRYFAGLGLPEEKIFIGYDAVDNEFFSQKAEEVRARSSDIRRKYELPEHYFLSLGRFVGKKNLSTLIRAYRLFLDASPSGQTHLVLVGSGEEEARLRKLCAELRLPVCDHPVECGMRNVDCRMNNSEWRIRNGAQSIRNPQSAIRNGTVHFYGFRQIEENPAFYALADAFILPSLYEEWGLVVNEAMASGLPVVVSETAGCVEDLLEAYDPEPGLSSHVQTLLQSRNLNHRVRQNGFVFNPANSEELSRILLLLEHAVGLRSIMGRHSRRIVEKFSCDNFARNALLAVQAALANRPLSRNSSAQILRAAGSGQ